MSAEFDYGAFYERLAQQVRVSTDFAVSVADVMQWCARLRPHGDWSRLSAFDAAAELEAARAWLPRVLGTTATRFPIRGAYFGLAEFSDPAEVEFADLYVGLLGAYDPGDTELNWLFGKLRYYPDEGYLESDALRQGGLLCNGSEDGLGTDGHICFSVAFAALLVRHTLDAEVFQLLSAAEPVGVVVGFDSGDLLKLGELTASGFRPSEGPMVA